MLPIDPGTSLSWEQPSARHSFHELRSSSDGVLHGSLELQGTRAVAASASGEWRIESDVTRSARIWRVSSGERLVSAERLGTGELAAELSRGSWTGRRVVTMASGRVFVWEPATMWRLAWRFRSDGGTALEFRRGRGILRANASIIVGDMAASGATASGAELELLAIVARYIVLVSDRDGAASSVAGVVTSF